MHKQSNIVLKVSHAHPKYEHQQQKESFIFFEWSDPNKNTFEEQYVYS